MKAPKRFVGMSSVAVAVATAVSALVGSTSVVEAQACRSSSYLPGLQPIVLRHASGSVVAIQGSSQNYGPGAHVWVNGNYVGQQAVPFNLAAGQIQLRLRSQYRMETWMGRVRQIYKPVPYVLVCGNWIGNLP